MFPFRHPSLALVLSSAAACSDASIASNNRRPEVQILSPADGSVLPWGDDVDLCLRVADPDTSHPPGSLAILLSSSQGGVLWSHEADAPLPEARSCGDGVGNLLLTIPEPVEGPHTVTVFAWDPLGAAGQGGSSFVVERPAGEAPGCTFLDPAAGDLYFEGEPVTLAAQVWDGDEEVEGLTQTWTSSIDGGLGSGVWSDGGVLSIGPLSLSPGDHYLALTVVDGRGLGGACGVPITVVACADQDLDGVTNCEGDCDDHESTAAPGLPELADGRDNDCDGVIDDGTALVDDDGDGFAEWQGDCDDADPTIYPGLVETADGRDEDCDLRIDEGTNLADDDGDGFCEGPGPCSDGSVDGDCDDADVFRHPGGTQVLCDGIDQACLSLASDAPDADADGFDVCAPSEAGDQDGLDPDCDDADAGRNPGEVEVLCDAHDDDCLSSTSDAPDADADGFDACAPGDPGDGDGALIDCDDAAPDRNPGEEEVADGQDQDCDAFADDGTLAWDDDGDGSCEGVPVLLCTDGTVIGDCDDASPLVHPGATELPNLLDDDCDGIADEGTVLYDDDGDGWSEAALDCDDGASNIYPGAVETADNDDQDCDGLVDEGTDVFDDDLDGWTELQGDCDDADPLTSPGSLEAIDGQDDDCDGLVDEDTAASDDDGDGYSEIQGDCNDAFAILHPGAPEDGGAGNDVGDLLDNDCDGFIDEGTLSYDDDGDGWAELAGDCDDGAWLVNPSQDELCGNGVDDDCEGTVDVPDVDGDGYVDALCSGDDCDDGDPNAHPGGTETFDLVDDDCDGQWDEGFITPGMVVISEIMKDPQAATDAMGEWFELLNPGGQAINLHGWIVHDDGTNAFTVDEDIILPAGARVVLGTWDIWADNGGYVPDYVYSYSAVGGMQLGNGADEIVLQHGIIVVDRVDYMTSGWPDPVGASLVLRGTALTATGNDLGSNWCTATTPMPGGDEGTPGAPGGC